MSDALNVARWLERSSVNGPGERFVLWLQGCPLRCPGCWNPDTWDFTPRRTITADDLVSLVGQASDIEGVTLTGGEPFSQAASLLPAVRELRQRGLSFMAFTGYELTELRDGAAQQLLNLLDVVVTGRFIEAQRTNALPWRGSANQEVVFLSRRYGPADLLAGSEKRLELHIDSSGTVVVTGFPDESWQSSDLP